MINHILDFKDYRGETRDTGHVNKIIYNAMRITMVLLQISNIIST